MITITRTQWMIASTYAAQAFSVGTAALCIILAANASSRGAFFFAAVHSLCVGVHAICFHVQATCRTRWRQIHKMEEYTRKLERHIKQKQKDLQ